MPVVPTICLPHLDVDAEDLQPLGGGPCRKGALPEGALLEESLPEEPLLERIPLRRVLLRRVLLTCWRGPRRGGRSHGVPGGCGTYRRLSRRWRRRRERRFSLPGGGQVATDNPSRRRKSTEPPSPLAAIPRLDGDQSPVRPVQLPPLQGRTSTRLLRSVCCCRTLVCCRTLFCSRTLVCCRISALAYLRTERTAARRANLPSGRQGAAGTARRPSTEPPAPALTSGVDGCFRTG
jgi:hypothetical protein